jgi:nitroreductase
VPFGAFNRYFAAIYFVCFEKTSSYEQVKILRGISRYKKTGAIGLNSSSLLRRNIHRLEKGLIMPSRRVIFATDFIQETVTAFARATKNAEHCKEELKWAESILDAYFRAVDLNNECISRAYLKYCQVDKLKQGFDVLPYPSSHRPDLNIDFVDYEKLCVRRRSVRFFSQRHVELSELKKAIKCASLAPSACNRQPFSFIVIKNKNKIKQISGWAGGAVSFNHQIPCLIAVVGDYSCYQKTRDKHLIYIDSSLASMTFMQALETLELSSCPINWPAEHKRDKLASDSLNLAPYQQIIMLIAVGYALPSGQIPYSQKKTVDHVLNVVED